MRPLARTAAPSRPPGGNTRGQARGGGRPGGTGAAGPSLAAAAGGPRSAFPWREAMAFGLGQLRLPPDAFWRMTPRELAAAMGAVLGPARAPLDRASLAALMARFPD
ncbi:rcc01693 family protein [Ancylobacter terrae]|uniref:rcc01693 family protein n=1 Tax=Ancylobacter sp. sgz301288 TaxID=3342077 RepID=UPI0038582721